MHIDDIRPSFETVVLQGRYPHNDEVRVCITYNLVVYEMMDGGIASVTFAGGKPSWSVDSATSSMNLKDRLVVDASLRCDDLVGGMQSIIALVGDGARKGAMDDGASGGKSESSISVGKTQAERPIALEVPQYLQNRRQLHAPGSKMHVELPHDHGSARKAILARIKHVLHLVGFFTGYFMVLTLIHVPLMEKFVMASIFVGIDVLLFIGRFPRVPRPSTITLGPGGISVAFSDGNDQYIDAGRVISTWRDKNGAIFIKHVVRLVENAYNIATLQLGNIDFKQVLEHLLPAVLSSPYWSGRLGAGTKDDERLLEEHQGATIIPVFGLIFMAVVFMISWAVICSLSETFTCLYVFIGSIAFVPYLIIRAFPITDCLDRIANWRRARQIDAWPPV